MSVTLTEMRENVSLTCTNTSVGGDGSGLSTKSIDRSIRWAGQRWMRETRMVRTIGTVNTVANTTTIDPSSMTDFLPGCLLNTPYISSNNRRMWVVELSAIIHQRFLSGASGVPEMIAFASSTVAHLYPTPDAIYTVSFHYWQPFTSFAVGLVDGDSVTLNIPDRYVDDLAIGAAGKLILSYPGIPSGPEKMALFEQSIMRAKGEVSEAGVWFSDQDDNWANSYARSMRL